MNRMGKVGKQRVAGKRKRPNKKQGGENSKKLKLDKKSKSYNKEKDEKFEVNINRPSDVNEGRTLFIRNVPFSAKNEKLKSIFEEFGEVEYALMVIDRETEYPKGTAFVKFKLKDAAQSCLQQSYIQDYDGGIKIDGQLVSVCYALSRNDITEKYNAKEKKIKDKRNLSLLKEGIIKPSSKAFAEMSEHDKSLRQKMDQWKKQRVKDLKYFVSKTRLCVWNIPGKIDGKKLRRIFIEAGGPGCVVTEARIMRDLKKQDASGDGVSKGFGFVNFTQHDHALKALNKINNNPKIFVEDKRPVVEFSVENRMAEKAKQRRLEKSQKKLQHIKNSEAGPSKQNEKGKQ